jgi:trigger factor
MAAFTDMAKKRVALGLLVSEYSKKLDLKVDSARVLDRIKEIASAYEQPQDVIAWLTADERRQGIEAQILEEQVLDKLTDGVSSKIKKISYADLKGIRI